MLIRRSRVFMAFPLSIALAAWATPLLRSTAFWAMSKAAEKIYKELSSHESQEHMLGEMQTRDELYDYLSYHKYEKEMDDILNKKDE